jgi:hypothetical protein
MGKPIQTSTASQSLASAALSHVLTIGSARTVEQNIDLLTVMVHFTSAVTQTATVTISSVNGLTTYTFVVDSSSLSSATNYVYRPNPAIPLKRGDTITVAVTNSGTPAITAYSEIRYRECD